MPKVRGSPWWPAGLRRLGAGHHPLLRRDRFRSPTNVRWVRCITHRLVGTRNPRRRDSGRIRIFSKSLRDPAACFTVASVAVTQRRAGAARSVAPQARLPVSRCSEQSRRKAVTQSYGTKATSSRRPPGRQRIGFHRCWLLGFFVSGWSHGPRPARPGRVLNAIREQTP